MKVFDASYDAWGRQTVTRNDIGLLRGYTGHEMISSLDIINMNGRLYDPVLGRFFSPDNYVQMPENSQSFNRYSYCLNNPLKYNDPSGESFAFVFAVFSVVSDMAIAAHNGENMLKAGAISALSAAATYGIGEWLGSTGKFSKELLRAGAHGLASGAISAISGNGRNFFSSFVSSAAASGIGSYASGVDINDGLMYASCAAVGGVVAWATGGDIILGAMNGLRIGMLNHEPHKLRQKAHGSPLASTSADMYDTELAKRSYRREIAKNPKLKQKIIAEIEADGILSFDEAYFWYSYGDGSSISVDASKVDLGHIDISNLDKNGDKKFNTLRNCNPKVGLVYGGITLHYNYDNTFTIKTDTYNFEMHRLEDYPKIGEKISQFFRNVETLGARFFHGSGTQFDIKFRGVYHNK